jgi:hypothetical protein
LDEGLRLQAEKEEMKIILSRKGFDSGSGGCPSPIFPDGSLMSLPIPDMHSRITYNEIAGNHHVSMGEAVWQLAGIPPTHRAHLDPDLVPGSLPRRKGWRPIFGQIDAAEGHLRRQCVGAGDIFLYFGLFRPVEQITSGWRFIRGSKPLHVLFGWLQIADRVPVSGWPASQSWALYHPHFSREPQPSNVIYVSTERLVLPSGKTTAFAGGGTFPRFSQILRLTAPDSDRSSQWLLPDWFYPDGRNTCLSYHGDPSRWEKIDGGVLLSAVSRGQEFVLDCDRFPEAVGWLKRMLTSA